MNERDPFFLRDILRAVSAIERYTKAGREAFFADELIQDAVVRRLETMGEAARNVSPALRDAEKAVPWKLMIGTRDNRDSRLLQGRSRCRLGDNRERPRTAEARNRAHRRPVLTHADARLAQPRASDASGGRGAVPHAGAGG